jgi:hypothetical protein
MKVAVCISGGLRCFKETFKFTEKFLLSEFDCDIFFYGVENKEGKNKNQTDFVSLYNPKDLVVNDTYHYHEIVNNFDINFNKKNNIISMFYNIYQCNLLRINHSMKHDIEYDLIIRYRPDCFMWKTISNEDIEQALQGKLVLPKCWSFSGITDLFAIGVNKTMNIYSNTYLNLNNIFNRNIILPEAILKSNCDLHNLEYFFTEKCMEFEFPDILDPNQKQITFNDAHKKNFKYNYDKI